MILRRATKNHTLASLILSQWKPCRAWSQPYSTWFGVTFPFSDHATHVRVDSRDVPVTVEDAILKTMGEHRVSSSREESPVPRDPNALLTPKQLLSLGSIWYLCAADYEHNLLEIPFSNVKPKRLSVGNATDPLLEGDYLRIHFSPRRFPRVHQHNWSESGSGKDNGVIVRSNTTAGYWIIDKPPIVPVHATVDNRLENVAHQLTQANPEYDYVATTQRIDTNTSGLLVVATKRVFAAYFSQLLQNKTANHIEEERDDRTMIKEYKCLVCIQPTETSSATSEWQRLHNLQGQLIRHYLQPSERAPKLFSETFTESWLECLLTIHQVKEMIPLDSSQTLWPNPHQVPPNTQAVAQVQIQLHTGRTHQIRGQMAALGFPLVGDEHYGGAHPVPEDESSSTQTTQLLALHCCKVGFPIPDYQMIWNKRKRREILRGVPSEDWEIVEWNRAWWNTKELQDE